MRSEQEIFDELARLCTSQGYVHALAFLCFRDNIVRYQGEMTADDMKHMFSAEHLVRTEISTLVGLMIKADIDYSLPDPAVTQQYMERTEELLEELHRAIAASPLVGVDLQEAVKKGTNPFATGDAFREAIFYGGESGYAFQYRDFSVKKYTADNAWLTSHKGFSIEEAREVITALSRFHTDKLTDVMDQMLVPIRTNGAFCPASLLQLMNCRSSQGSSHQLSRMFSRPLRLLRVRGIKDFASFTTSMLQTQLPYYAPMLRHTFSSKSTALPRRSTTRRSIGCAAMQPIFLPPCCIAASLPRNSLGSAWNLCSARRTSTLTLTSTRVRARG